MTTFRELQDEVLLALQGYGLDQPRVTFLNAALDSSALVISVEDASNITAGIAEIGDELVFISSVDKGSSSLTLSPDGRGYFSTTASAHASGTRLTLQPVWPRNRVRGAINDVIEGTYPTLFGTDQTQFEFNPSVSTYSLPADAERILSVSADLNGPSREQQIIRRYSFSSVAPTDDWATTNTITFQEGVTPGRTVTVTYLKSPSPLEGDGDSLTASGLRNTAKLAIVYGACSQLLSYMDAARLPVASAQADEFDDRNPVGMASRISGQLYLRYQAELEKERQRQRAETPLAINVRIR